MERILITGGSGFLGGHLVARAVKKYDVTTTYFKHAHNSDHVRWVYQDLSDIDSLESLIQSVQPTCIIHNAAISKVDLCEQEREKVYTANVESSEKLADISERNNIRLIYLSSDMVFDGQKGNYKEDDKVNPVNYYGQTKVKAEEKIRQRCSNHVIVRVALIFGISLTGSDTFFETTLHNLKNNQDVNLFYDQYRSPVLADNLTEALIELIDHPFCGTINLGGSERISRYDFGVKMAEVFQLPQQHLIKRSMHEFKALANRPVDISMDISLASSILRTRMLNCEQSLIKILNNTYKSLVPE